MKLGKLGQATSMFLIRMSSTSPPVLEKCASGASSTPKCTLPKVHLVSQRRQQRSQIAKLQKTRRLCPHRPAAIKEKYLTSFQANYVLQLYTFDSHFSSTCMFIEPKSFANRKSSIQSKLRDKLYSKDNSGRKRQRRPLVCMTVV